MRDNEVAGMRGISKSRSLETSKSKLKFNFEQLLMKLLWAKKYMSVIKIGNNILLDPERKMLVGKSRKAGLNRAVARFKGG